MQTAYRYLEETLQKPTAFTETGVEAVLKELCPTADCIQQAAVAYQVISDFYRQGRLQVETRYVPGQTDALKAPKSYLSLRN